MEVHAHSHTPRKKLTHYFWEFLMLFLAVFCGFLAEYQLEHVIEHQREKQFMKSMIEDVEKDVIGLENELERVKTQYERLDSLAEIIYEGDLGQFQVRKMYELQRRYLYPLNLKLINRTELQLTNSGGMRLIRNKHVSDTIIYYWSITELLYETKDNINAHRDKAKDISFIIFNNKYYKHGEDWSLGFPLDPSRGEPALLTKNPTILNEFANRTSHMSDLLKFNYTRRINIQVSNGKKLLQLIKKEYHIN